MQFERWQQNSNRKHRQLVIRNINNYKEYFSPKHEGFKKEIVTQQSKAQKDFHNKIEKEQIKITEEIKWADKDIC